MEEKDQENINIFSNNNLLMDCVKTSPLVLLGINDKDIINQCNNLLPFSTGFEIECNYDIRYDLEDLKEKAYKIPDILDVGFTSGEFRFRIPNGLRGILCLYNISLFCKKYLTLNEESGIHYHIDFSDVYDYYNISQFSIIHNKCKYWILEELSKWEYKGTYNKKEIGYSHYWLRFNPLKTLEFRIGEMTFDYELLLKRILHCNRIVKKIREEIDAPYQLSFNSPSKYLIKDYLYFINNNTEIDDYTSIYNRMKHKVKQRIIHVTW